MIGIFEQAWNAAQDRMGTRVATAAFTLAFEIQRGRGCLTGRMSGGMVEKAGAGELYYERSFCGRLSG